MSGSHALQRTASNGDTNGIAKERTARNALVDKARADATLVWDKKVPNTELEKFSKHIEEKYNLHFEMCKYFAAKKQKEYKTYRKRKRKIWGIQNDSYWDLHKWSITNCAEFWGEIWKYTDVICSESYEKVVKEGNDFMDVEWFTGARFNYAENMLRYRDDKIAIIYADELGYEEKITYAEVYEEVKLYAAALRNLGLTKGDRVACYMSNRKEAIYANLAATSVGALWGGVLPYYGSRAAKNIVQMMEPKFLIAVDHHQDNGMQFDTFENLSAIVNDIESLEKVIIVPTKEATLSKNISNIRNSCFLDDFLELGKTSNGKVPELKFEQLPFSYPISINFTSGTTGLPKGPVHSAGSFIAQVRDLGLHCNLSRGDVAFNFYPVGWVVWELFVPCLTLGVTLVLYNGSQYYPVNGRNIWDILSYYNTKFTFLSTSVVDKMEKQQVMPSPNSDLNHLQTIGIGGSPVKKQNFEYLKRVKKDLFVSSLYGATEMFGVFSGFDLNTKCYGGEIQVPALGVDIKCFNSKGQSVIGQCGELVVATPSPSFPICLWKDENNARLNDTYFSKFPDVWSQHDECWINPKTNGIVIIGRSDDTLKQNGKRFGSGDIYFAIHQMEELQDYICVGQDKINGDSRAVLFVKLKSGHIFTPQLRKKVEDTISKELWYQYVPEVIVEVKDIPYNVNNKKMESLVKKIVETNTVPEVMNAMNPECLQYYCNIPEVQK